MSWKYLQKKIISTGRAYEILRFPRITEKSTLVADNNQIVFIVSIDAKKYEIKQAVEKLFNVKVTAVNAVINPGKTKRFRGRLGQRKNIKKAYVTLNDGESVDISAGL